MPEFSPEAFAAVFTHESQPTIIGGQAVNLWAEHYSNRAPELRSYQPFVSKDADLWADRRTVTALANATGWAPQFYDQPRTHAVALLTKKDPHTADTLRVEVLKDVYGLTDDDLRKSVLMHLPEGGSVRLLEPAPLLKGKLATLSAFKATARPNDVRHVRLLIPILREDALDRLAATTRGELTERDAIAAFRYTAEVVSSPIARHLAQEQGFDFRSAFPAALATTELAKLRNFATKELPHFSQNPSGAKPTGAAARPITVTLASDAAKAAAATKNILRFRL